MGEIRVTTIVGTRPEIIRLSALIEKLDANFHHRLVHTGQNSQTELNQIFFDELELRGPDSYLGLDTSSLGFFLGEGFKRLEAEFNANRPDACLILGDTNSALFSILAQRMRIPVYHLEAGNRSFDANVPEELNRKLVDSISSFNLAYSEHARRNLLREGHSERFVAVTGSPIPEVVRRMKSILRKPEAFSRLGLVADGFILASLHRQETVDSQERLQSALEALNSSSIDLAKPVVLSTHPRTARLVSDNANFPNILFEPPFGYIDYIDLQEKAFCVVSDSGSISEEAAVLGIPAVTLRDSMERLEALEAGGIVLSGVETNTLTSSINLARALASRSSDIQVYPDFCFSDRVVSMIQSTAKLWPNWANVRV